MNRTIKISGCVVAVGVALISLGVWRTTPPSMLSEVALPDTWSSQNLSRDGVSVALEVKPLAKDGVLREGEFADVQFRVNDSASGQPLSGVNPGAWLDPETVAADQAQGREQSCKSRVRVFLKSSIGARPLLDLNSYFLLVMNRDASVSRWWIRRCRWGASPAPWHGSTSNSRRWIG